MPPRSAQQEILKQLSTIGTDVALIKQEQRNMQKGIDEMKPEIAVVNSLRQEIRGVNGDNGIASDNRKHKRDIKAIWRVLYIATGAVTLASATAYLKWIGVF